MPSRSSASAGVPGSASGDCSNRRWPRRKRGFGGAYLHPSLFDMAAAYGFHIAESQPFVDGNKRAGLGAALVFLKLNGIDLDDPDERLYQAMMAVASHSLDKNGLAALMRELSGPRLR